MEAFVSLPPQHHNLHKGSRLLRFATHRTVGKASPTAPFNLHRVRRHISLDLTTESPTPQPPYPTPTWKEHMSVSSTLIMAPALSNSPQ